MSGAQPSRALGRIRETPLGQFIHFGGQSVVEGIGLNIALAEPPTFTVYTQPELIELQPRRTAPADTP
jgi:hypothetical protein